MAGHDSVGTLTEEPRAAKSESRFNFALEIPRTSAASGSARQKTGAPCPFIRCMRVS
jgi:hypothetical protein